MAKFIYQEIGGITNKGEHIVKPRFVGGRQVSNEEFVAEVAHRTAFSKGSVRGLLGTIAELLPDYLSQGNSVRLDGLGLFTPTLTMRGDMDVTESDEQGNEVQHNAHNVVLDTIRITPDRTLVRATQLKCRPTHDRYQGNSRAMDTPYTKEERLQLALNHLEQEHMMTVTKYMELTALRHTMAARELHQWSEGENAPLRKAGRGSHSYYILNKV